MSLTISELVVYPVKSLRGVRVGRWPVERRGLRHDRRWLLVDAEGKFLSQRSDRRLALVDVEILETHLRISAMGHGELLIPLQEEGPRRCVRIWDDTVDGVEVGPEAGRWFSDYLESPTALVYMPEDVKRPVPWPEASEGDLVGFGDSCPILVAGQSSLDDLNGRLAQPIPIRRFRPNLVISGASPFAEDEWTGIETGEVALRRIRGCGRCSVTTIDIDTGEASDEPLRTLATFRKQGKNVYFGSYYAPDLCGELAVGDAVNALA